MRQELADKAVRAPEKSSQRTMILTYCSAEGAERRRESQTLRIFALSASLR